MGANERTNETYIKRKKEKNNKDDRLRRATHPSLRTFSSLEMTNETKKRLDGLQDGRKI